MTISEARLVTATEFVTDILCELSLRHERRLRLADTMHDQQL